MPTQQHSLLQLHAAVLLFGGTALFAKLIGLPALDITVYRSFVAALCLFLLLSFKDKTLALNSAKDYKIGLVLGALMGVHWVTYFSGMQMAGITIGMIAFFTYPVITVFLEPLVHRSKPKAKDIVSALVVILGIYLLVPEANLGNQVTMGIVTGIVSACFFALRNIIHKKHFSHYSGPQTMMYQTIVAGLMLCLFVEVPPMQVPASDWWLIVLVGIVFTALPHSLFASSLRNLSATTAGLISCLQPLYGSLFAFAILAEQPSFMTLMGGALVISAAFFETWSVSRKKRMI
ncbi:MAG: DMT family transporter [Colwellia sp.]|nr:DMT family transporter [Colwellia sp.]